MTKDQVLAHNRKIGEMLPEIWAAVAQQIELADQQGLFEPMT